MRLRDAHIPIVLWVCAAAVLHLGGGEQADRLAEVHENKAKLRAAARSVAEPPPVPITVDLDLSPTEPSPPPEEAKADDGKTEPDPSTPEKDPELAKKPEPKPEKKPEADKRAEQEKEKEKEKEKEPEKQPEPAPMKVIPVPDEKKIAVQQHQEEDEAPNPEAKYLAEKNHKVAPGEEAHATITSTTENDKNPTPGTHQGPPSELPGNGDKTVVAQDENRSGEKVAPNVIPKGASAVEKPVAQKDPPPKPGNDKGDDKPLAPSDAKSPTNVAKAPQAKSDGKGATSPAPAAPDVAAGPNGGWAAPPTGPSPGIVSAPSSSAPPGQGNGIAKALPNLPMPGGKKWTGSLGFGAKGENGKPSVSIDEKVAKAAIGMDQLDRLKKVEGETKLSMHRGSWKSSSLERWRAAIENYVPGVKPGNQTNLGTAAAPWATYLAQIHVRLHPIFADGFVEGLGDLPAGHPLNDKTLITRMEIVMRPDGTIHHLGIVKPSGVTAFDIAALDSVDRAAPFGKAPEAIVSPDGLVYLHWEFHRDEMRCSNLNAYPYVLKEGSPKAPPAEPPSKPVPPAEGKPPMPALPPGGQLGSLRSPHG
jgi:hypothetical protein